ncbi:MAG: hypothetical protein Q9184_004183 [Pyrenodesmia sp. 2 TL-2023]
MASPIVETIANVRSRVAGGGLPGDSRRALLKEVKELQYELETPKETCNRYRNSGLDLSIAYIFYHIKLFDILLKHGKSPVSTGDLAQETKTDPKLLGRLLRYAASSGLVKQSSEDTWTASRLTHSMVAPSSEADLEEAFTSTLPLWVDLPRFLAQTSYQNPTDSMNTVHQLAWNTPLSFFDWMTEHPEHYAVLNKFMAANRMAQTGVQVFPFEDKVPALFKTESPETPLFVDVGGGRGQMCRAFRARYPDLPGRVIFQDLPQTMADAPSGNGTEAMAHNFFHPQPIRGAKIYYLRHVLHDWPDAKAEDILKRVVEAMDKESVILIDEKVLPDVGASSLAAGLDLSMMSHFAASERSERAWKDLLGKVGLHLEYLHRYEEDDGDAVIPTVGEDLSSYSILFNPTSSCNPYPSTKPLPSALTMPSLRIGFVPEHFSTPLHFARTHFALTATLIPFPSGTGHMVTSLRSGEIDLAIGLTEGWVAALSTSTSQEFKIVGTYVESPLCWAISTGRDRDDIHTIGDLRGKKMGVSRVGSGSYVMGFVLADREGWLSQPQSSSSAAAEDEEKEKEKRQPFEVQTLQNFENLRKAVGDGTADFFMWEYFTSKRYYGDGGGDGKEVLYPIKKLGEIYTPWSSWKIVAREELVGGRAVEEVLEKLNEGIKWFREHEEEAVEYISQELDYEEEDAREWIKGVRFADDVRAVRRSMLEKTVDTLRVAGVIGEGSKVEEWVGL